MRTQVVILCFTFALATQIQAISFFPKIPKFPEGTKPQVPQPRPDDIVPVDKPNGGKPAEPPAKPAAPAQTPSPGSVQSAMAKLEKKLAKEVAGSVTDLAPTLASALLESATGSATGRKYDSK